MSRKVTYSVPRLFQLWRDLDVPTVQIAREFGVCIATLRSIARRHGLGKRFGAVRKIVPPQSQPKFVNDHEPEPLDEPVTDSLALSPWVEARVKELREEKLRALRDEPVLVTQSRVSRYRCGRA